MNSILIADPIAAEGIQILERGNRVRVDAAITAELRADERFSKAWCIAGACFLGFVHA